MYESSPDGIREESPRLKGHKVLISLTAGPSSNTVSEMVEFSFGICWQVSVAVYELYILESSEQQEHSPGPFPREIALMMVERHCLGLGSQRCLSCHSLT